MKLGFIGTGNMAGAIMGGIIKKGIIAPEEIIGSDIMEAGRERAKKEHGIHVTADNIEVTQKAEVLVLSVKPQFYAQTIAEIKDTVREDQLIITIAPGKTLAWLEEQFGKKVKIVRTMPNTPALVGEGMTAACPNDTVTEEEKNYALELLSSFGKVEIVPEHLIDAVVAVSGSSPAYIFMIIEAMADGAVAEGMPDHRRISSQHRQYLEVQRWYSRQESIRESSKIWYVHRQEQRLRQYVYLRNLDLEAQ